MPTAVSPLPTNALPATVVSKSKKEKLDVSVTKPIPLEFDLGHLVCFDSNPLDSTAYTSDRESFLLATLRDGAQALINQVLTTLPIKSIADGVFAELPDPVTPLPREKPVPKEKEPTKWELFAKKKGIAPKARDGKQVFDEAKGEWVAKWGYQGQNKDVENQWLVEVDESKTGKEEDKRKMSRDQRKAAVKLNERQMKKNRGEKEKTFGGGASDGGVGKKRKPGKARK